MPKPNILWICTDQQRWDTLGCYGNPFVRTPRLDRLAERGVLFEHAYSQSPICTPSRASFLTGRYPRTTRTRQNGQCIPDDEILITRQLAEAGYVCGLSGKLHLSTCEPQACPHTERRIEDGYSVFHWSHHPSPDWPENEYANWLRTRGVEYRGSPFRGSAYVQAGMPAEHHQTAWCAGRAVDFIENAAKSERPWLFSYNCFDPHFPFDPPVEYLERYLDRLDEIPLPNYVEGELAGKPRFQQPELREAYHHVGSHRFAEMTDADHRLVRAAYWAMIDLIDAQVGRMLDALERTGQADNTIVIFTSDHGELLGDHGLYYKGPYFYDPAIRVPLIISWPGRIEPGRCSALVELMDLAPTLLDAVGLPWHSGMQARSFWSTLLDPAKRGAFREDVYCEYYNGMHAQAEPKPFATMLRTERRKLVVAHGLEPGELYDLAEDPNETHNRWDDPGYQTIKMQLLKRLSDRMAWTVDPLPGREGAF